MVEMTGIEPVSRKQSARVSPGAGQLQRFPRQQADDQAAASVASLVHDSLQSLGLFTFTVSMTPGSYPTVEQAGRPLTRLSGNSNRSVAAEINCFVNYCFAAVKVGPHHYPLLWLSSPCRNLYIPIYFQRFRRVYNKFYVLVV